jgi:hypothetical protein
VRLPEQVLKQPEVARGLVADLTLQPRELLGKEHRASEDRPVPAYPECRIW